MWVGEPSEPPRRVQPHPRKGAQQYPLRGLIPEWQTIRWLQQCDVEIMDDKVVWWALIDPLTDGSDATSQALARRLVAMWRWTFTLSGYRICPPALTSLNIGQFLPLGSTGTVQEWLPTYAHTLQHVGEVAHGRSWCSNMDDYTPQISLLVDAVLEATDMQLLKAEIVDCWNTSKGDIPHQCDLLLGQARDMTPNQGHLGCPGLPHAHGG